MLRVPSDTCGCSKKDHVYHRSAVLRFATAKAERQPNIPSKHLDLGYWSTFSNRYPSFPIRGTEVTIVQNDLS